MRGENGETILPSHVVLKAKRDENDHTYTFKARLEARGQGFDLVYAPVIDFALV